MIIAWFQQPLSLQGRHSPGNGSKIEKLGFWIYDFLVFYNKKFNVHLQLQYIQDKNHYLNRINRFEGFTASLGVQLLLSGHLMISDEWLVISNWEFGIRN